MRILIIDNNIMADSWGARDLARFAAQVPGATVMIRRAPQDDLPAEISRFDRLVISGSMTAANEQAPWIDKLDEKIRQFINLGRPTLGVCYGHQSIVRALGGLDHVRRGPRGEFGWTLIEQLEPSALLQGLPSAFYSFSSHYDEVCRLPAGFKRLARSERCDVQAFRIEGAPVYGIQFHPEKSREAGERIVEARRKKGELETLVNPDGGKRLYKEEIGQTIFRNFFELK